jgi:hypothetical protein
LPGPLGGMHRLDQEIVGVGFPLGNFGRFSDVHRTLYTLYSQAKSRAEFIIFVTIYKAKAFHGKSSTYKTYGPSWSQNRVSSAEVGLRDTTENVKITSILLKGVLRGHIR